MKRKILTKDCVKYTEYRIYKTQIINYIYMFAPKTNRKLISVEFDKFVDRLGA